jgi:hypothetical protein
MSGAFSPCCNSSRAAGARPQEKKERSGLQSARDELIDKGAFIMIVGCMRPELGEFIQ